MPDLTLGLKRAGRLDGRFAALGWHGAGVIHHIAACQRLPNLLWGHGVLRQPVEGTRNIDFLLLLADALDLGDSPNAADYRLDPLGIVFQLAVAVVVAMNRQQHRDRVPEIIVNDWAFHPFWKIRLL